MKADKSYRNRILIKAMKSWLSYILYRRQKTERRSILYHIIKGIDSERILTKAVSTWKKYTQESTHHLRDICYTLFQSKLKRMFVGWKLYSKGRKQFKIVSRNLEEYINTKLQINYFLQ